MQKIDIEDLQTESDMKLSDMIDLSLENWLYQFAPSCVHISRSATYRCYDWSVWSVSQVQQFIGELKKKDGNVLAVDAEATE
jgi:hypothetical protein